eukprot:CAMPEP_0114244336 /NCGR_PEP_ID=MMETSP0058-20121206/11280_1 /TAXON_ID=36894 /ORGANISM="Pyramimonas parkeae, CCMP726" /LENGTH=630 /DNA_ID=CAMNT_0001357259 /DNA_START=175 /DNA_END=2067 /DNA_ORIENTATION=+
MALDYPGRPAEISQERHTFSNTEQPAGDLNTYVEEDSSAGTTESWPKRGGKWVFDKDKDAWVFHIHREKIAEEVASESTNDTSTQSASDEQAEDLIHHITGKLPPPPSALRVPDRDKEQMLLAAAAAQSLRDTGSYNETLTNFARAMEAEMDRMMEQAAVPPAARAPPPNPHQEDSEDARPAQDATHPAPAHSQAPANHTVSQAMEQLMTFISEVAARDKTKADTTIGSPVPPPPPQSEPVLDVLADAEEATKKAVDQLVGFIKSSTNAAKPRPPPLQVPHRSPSAEAVPPGEEARSAQAGEDQRKDSETALDALPEADEATVKAVEQLMKFIKASARNSKARQTSKQPILAHNSTKTAPPQESTHSEMASKEEAQVQAPDLQKTNDADVSSANIPEHDKSEETVAQHSHTHSSMSHAPYSTKTAPPQESTHSEMASKEEAQVQAPDLQKTHAADVSSANIPEHDQSEETVAQHSRTYGRMSHAPYSTKERSHKEVAQSGTEEDTQAQSSNLQNEHAAPAPNSRMHEHNKQESVAGGASISAHTRLHTTSSLSALGRNAANKPLVSKFNGHAVHSGQESTSGSAKDFWTKKNANESKNLPKNGHVHSRQPILQKPPRRAGDASLWTQMYG